MENGMMRIEQPSKWKLKRRYYKTAVKRCAIKHKRLYNWTP